jgi:HAD superfamily hydrolase (TIGR01509 family)
MRAVAFDAMGVLYSTADDLRATLVPFAIEHGSSLSEENIARVYRRAMIGDLSAADLWRELGVRGDPTELEAEYLGRYSLTPGIRDLLDQLHADGIVLGCISNDIAEWSQTRRARLGLDRRIAHWTVSGEIRARKPDPRIYQSFVESVGLEAQDVVFVDDRVANVDAAAALGFITMLVDFAAPPTEPNVLRSVADLRTALTSILSGRSAVREPPASTLPPTR